MADGAACWRPVPSRRPTCPEIPLYCLLTPLTVPYLSSMVHIRVVPLGSHTRITASYSPSDPSGAFHAVLSKQDHHAASGKPPDAISENDPCGGKHKRTVARPQRPCRRQRRDPHRHDRLRRPRPRRGHQRHERRSRRAAGGHDRHLRRPRAEPAENAQEGEAEPGRRWTTPTASPAWTATST